MKKTTLLLSLLLVLVLICLVIAKQPQTNEEVTVEDSEPQHLQQHTTTPSTTPQVPKEKEQQQTSIPSLRRKISPFVARPFQMMRHYLDRLADFEKTFFDHWKHPLLGGDDEDDAVADKEAEQSLQKNQDSAEDTWWPTLRDNFIDADWQYPIKRMNQLFKREGWGMKEAKFDEQETAYVVSMPLPGIEKDDIKIELIEPPKRDSQEEEDLEEDEYAASRFRKQLRKLIIKVNHRESTKDENGKGEKVITRHNSYVLPKRVDASKLNAQYKNGLLTVTVPKIIISEEQRKKRKVEPIVHTVAIQ